MSQTIKYTNWSTEEIIVENLKRAGFTANDRYGQIVDPAGNVALLAIQGKDTWYKADRIFLIDCEGYYGQEYNLKKILEFAVKPGDLFSLNTYNLESSEVQFCASFTGNEKTWAAFSDDPIKAVLEARLIYLDATAAGNS